MLLDVIVVLDNSSSLNRALIVLTIGTLAVNRAQDARLKALTVLFEAS